MYITLYYVYIFIYICPHLRRKPSFLRVAGRALELREVELVVELVAGVDHRREVDQRAWSVGGRGSDSSLSTTLSQNGCRRSLQRSLPLLAYALTYVAPSDDIRLRTLEDPRIQERRTATRVWPWEPEDPHKNSQKSTAEIRGDDESAGKLRGEMSKSWLMNLTRIFNTWSYNTRAAYNTWPILVKWRKSPRPLTIIPINIHVYIYIYIHTRSLSLSLYIYIYMHNNTTQEWRAPPGSRKTLCALRSNRAARRAVIYIYIYIYIYMLYIYIYIICYIYIFIYIYIYMCVYIYIYRKREREREREMNLARGAYSSVRALVSARFCSVVYQYEYHYPYYHLLWSWSLLILVVLCVMIMMMIIVIIMFMIIVITIITIIIIISSSSSRSSSSSSAHFGPVRGVLGLRVLRQLERVDVVLRIRTMNLLGWLRLGWLEIARNRPRPCYAGFVFSPIVLYYCCFSLLCCSLFPFFLATKISKSYAQSPY